MLCARECPDWCIYIEAHKYLAPPRREGGKPRQKNALDRFDIDFSLCMYCGICVEVCPFEALFWSPEYEFSEVQIADLLHDKDRLDAVDADRARLRGLRGGLGAEGQEGAEDLMPTFAADLLVAQNIAFYVIAAMMVVRRDQGRDREEHRARRPVARHRASARMAAMFILLAAEFIAITQVLVYIGAIVVLFLFGIMLTRAPMGSSTELDNGPQAKLVGGVIGAGPGRRAGLRPLGRLPRPGVRRLRRAAHGRGQRLDLLAPTWCRSRSSRCSCSPRSSAPSSWRGATDVRQPVPLPRGDPVLHRRLRRARPPQRRARADVDRADPELGEHQPGRLRRSSHNGPVRARSSPCSSSPSPPPRSASASPSC